MYNLYSLSGVMRRDDNPNCKGMSECKKVYNNGGQGQVGYGLGLNLLVGMMICIM